MIESCPLHLQVVSLVRPVPQVSIVNAFVEADGATARGIEKNAEATSDTPATMPTLPSCRRSLRRSPRFGQTTRQSERGVQQKMAACPDDQMTPPPTLR